MVNLTTSTEMPRGRGRQANKRAPRILPYTMPVTRSRSNINNNVNVESTPDRLAVSQRSMSSIVNNDPAPPASIQQVFQPTEPAITASMITGLQRSIDNLSSIVLTQGQRQRPLNADVIPTGTGSKSTQPPLLDLTSGNNNMADTSDNNNMEDNQIESLLDSTGDAPGDLPLVELVSPSIRRDIQAGKDVNLACLLIPGYKPQDGQRHVIVGDEAFSLRPLQDSRLNKSLTIQEFVAAFSIYKSIMCERYPSRLKELDTYQRSIIEMSWRFGGLSFYEYHRAFSARAAALLSYKRKINWAIRDNDLYCSIFAGHRANACTICNGLGHCTEFCPQTSSTSKKTNFSYRGDNTGPALPSTSHDKQGRPRIVVQGKEVCNNFNSPGGCKKFNCNFTHACLSCHSSDHHAINGRCMSKNSKN